MAEEPIRKEDIIDGEAIIGELKELIKLLQVDLVGALESVKKAAKGYGEALQMANPATDEGKQKIKETAAGLDELAQETIQLTAAEKKLLEIENKIQATYDEKYKDEVRLRQALNERNKEVAEEVKLEKLADGSLAKLRLQLAQLKKAYTEASPGARGGITENVQKLDKEVKKLESDMGVHQRKVGDYGLALKGIGTKMLALTGITVGVQTALNFVKGAFESTGTSADRLEAMTEGVKQGFDAIKRAVVNLDFKDFIKNVKAAYEEGKRYAEGLDEVDDKTRALQMAEADAEVERIKLLKISRSEKYTKEQQIEAGKKIIAIEEKLAGIRTGIAEQAFQNEADNIVKNTGLHIDEVISLARMDKAMLDNIESGKKYVAMVQEKDKYDALNIALARSGATLSDEQRTKYNQLIILIGEATEETKRYGHAFNNMATDEQMQRLTDKYTAWQSASVSAMNNTLRVATQVDAKEAKLHEKKIDDIEEERISFLSAKEQEEIAYQKTLDKESADYVKSLGERQRAEEAAFAASLPSYEQNEEARKKIHNDRVAEELRVEKEKEEKIMAAISQSLAVVNDIANSYFNAKLSRLDREKNKELSNEKLTKEEKDAINRKYAQKENEIIKKQIVTNTALAVMRVWSGSGSWVEKVIENVAVLAEGGWAYSQADSQTFGEGGDVDGKPHSQGGTMIEAEKGEYVIRKSSNAKYHDLIEAINKDNPMLIAEEIRNRSFHTVWGGVTTSLSQVSKQDPYTRMMYELMKNDIKIYVDSNGDTNVVSPDGSKRIIRKYTA